MRAAILCSETPFVGDEPSVAKCKVAAGESLLRDHWPYNEEELIRLCDLCFDWMKSGGEKEKEVLMVGGDIHIGVTSAIFDKESGRKYVTICNILYITVNVGKVLHGFVLIYLDS